MDLPCVILLNYWFLYFLVLELQANLGKLLMFFIIFEKIDWTDFLKAQLKKTFYFWVKIWLYLALFFDSQKNLLSFVGGR